MSAVMYRLMRHRDPSGVSGTGPVGTVVEFDSGLTVLHWDTDTPSIAVHTDSRQIEQLHGHGGATELVPMDCDRLLNAYRRLMPFLLQDGATIKPIVVGPHPDHPDRLRAVFHDERSWAFWTALLDGSTHAASHEEVNGEVRHRWIDSEGDIWFEYFTPLADDNDPLAVFDREDRGMSEHTNPPEPTGLGAVVELFSGELLIRYSTGTLAPWIAADGGFKPERPYRYYSDFVVSRVLSEGVER